MKIFLSLLISIVALQAIEKNDFAYERIINISSEDGMVKVGLPIELYGHLNSSSMLDLAVFDSDNKIMPHSIEKLNLSEQSIQREVLPFSRVKRIKENKGTVLGISYQGRELTLSENNKVSDEDYILDASKMKDGIDYLEIKSDDREYMLKTDIACSDDLSYWREISATQMLANITMQDSKIVKERLNLNIGTCKYLKIHTQKPLNIATISAVKIQRLFQKPLPQPVEISKVNNGVEFRVSKQVKVKGLQFVLPVKEQLYKLNLFSKNDGDKEWSFVKQITIYTLQNGAIKNLETSFVENADNYRIEPAKNSYLPDELKLGFMYDHVELYFIAQGKAPYSLVYGSIKGRAPSANLSSMIEINKNFIHATLDEEKVLNTNANKVQKETNYTAILVWISLAIGIVVLGFMSYKLIGELKIKK